MLHQYTLTTIKTLKLPGMAAAFEEQHLQPVTQTLSFEDRFGLIVDREVSHRDNQRLGRLLKGARLKHNACVEDIDYRSGRDSRSHRPSRSRDQINRRNHAKNKKT